MKTNILLKEEEEEDVEVGEDEDGEEDEDEEEEVEGDEKYCYCNRGFFGEMVGCDNEDVCLSFLFSPLLSPFPLHPPFLPTLPSLLHFTLKILQ